MVLYGVEWCCMGLTWARIHRESRVALFSPGGVDGGPLLDAIGAKRVTVVRYADGTGETIEDVWNVEGANRDLTQPWTGLT